MSCHYIWLGLRPPLCGGSFSDVVESPSVVGFYGFVQDAAEDWKEEGGRHWNRAVPICTCIIAMSFGTDQGILTEQSQRPEHVAIALHTAASIYFQLKDTDSVVVWCQALHQF